MVLTDYASAMLHFDAHQYWLTQFHGDWAEEARPQESLLTSGLKVLDSKLGTRAGMYQTPAFLLSLDEAATETSGAVLAGTLAWTGNFRLAFEVDNGNSLRVFGGHQPLRLGLHAARQPDFYYPRVHLYLQPGGQRARPRAACTAGPGATACWPASSPA